MDFPIGHLMDEDACYEEVVGWLHPGGLACPRCHGTDASVHRFYRAPVLDYRCKGCGKVYNAFTGTALQGTRRRPSALVLILRGVATGVPTARLARELGCSRGHLLELRHKLQANAAARCDRTPLPDDAVEADEMYQNAGEKRGQARRPGRPAAAQRQQGGRAWHVGDRSAAGARGGGAAQRPARAAGGPAELGGGAGPPDGGAPDPAGGDGVHRRVVGVQAAEGRRAGARGGQPQPGGVRPG